MSRVENEVFAERVVHYRINIDNYAKKKIVDHFIAEGKSRFSIYTILRRYEATGAIKFKKIPGRTVKKILRLAGHRLLR